MPKHVRSSSHAEVSRETTENLYELGLLNRPRSRQRAGANNEAGRSAQCKTLFTTKN